MLKKLKKRIELKKMTIAKLNDDEIKKVEAGREGDRITSDGNLLSCLKPQCMTGMEDTCDCD